MSRKPQADEWDFAPPSERCETVVKGIACGRQAVAAYPSMGGGYHSLCALHFPKHQNYCVTLDEARRGKVPKVAALSAGRSQ